MIQIIISFFLLFSCDNHDNPKQNLNQEKWVKQTFNNMSNRERIAQLFMAVAYGDKNKNIDGLIKLVKNYNIGSIIWMSGNSIDQTIAINKLQEMAKTPLLMATDAEWGTGMRLKDGFSYPYQMTMGAMNSDSLVYEMGQQTAEQLKRLGLHINFAPVVDVNNNSNNPVISYRSFGENPQQVANYGLKYMNGMQDNGIISTAKHFPGHGDTDVDSHHNLPVINHSINRLQQIELLPFKTLIENNVNSVMIAHLSVPAIDPSPNNISTVSKPVITSLLKQKLKFNGLIISDAMNMKALTKNYPIGEADVRALIAGIDIIEITENIPKAIKSIEMAIKNGRISQKEINEKCLKILNAKYKAGLHNWKPIKVKNIQNDINKKEYHLLKRNIIKESITAIKNQDNILPIKNLNKKFAVISFDRKGNKITTFQKIAKKYVGNIGQFSLPAKATKQQLTQLKDTLNHYEYVIIACHQVNKRPGNYSGFSNEVIKMTNEIAKEKQTVLAYFRNPYTLSQFNYFENAKSIIIAYQDGDDYQSLIAQAIFGAIDIKGKLPVTISDNYKIDTSIKVNAVNRLQYGIPEEVGINEEFLKKKIDSVFNYAIDRKATPGGVVLVAKQGKVVFEKPYGNITYSDTTRVTTEHVYDIASITKIVGPLPALMKLAGDNQFDINKKISHYQPYFNNSNKENITWKNALGHQAGLHPWIPFYNYIYDKNIFGKIKKKYLIKNNGKYISSSLSRKQTKAYPYELATNLYLHKNFKKRIYESIKYVDNNKTNEYKYSGLSFYLMPDLITNITNIDYQTYLGKTFYDPIGASTLCYLPKTKIDESLLIPTEYDLYFRYRLIRGEVHDEGAAFMKGISGNAGLFSNANDLAKIMQMYLNKGYYGGERYISPDIIDHWTSYVFHDNNNRRGLGFDKPTFKYSENGNASLYASELSYGHTAFTGGRVWVDPEHELIYIILANRVYPTRFNTTLYNLNTRTKIEEYIYESFLNKNTLSYSNEN